MATYITLPSLSANKVLTASYMNTLHDDLQVFSKHNHSGSAGEGNASFVGANAASPFAYRYEIIPHIAPSQTGVNTLTQDTGFFSACRGTSNPCPACVLFPVGLMSGTYSFGIFIGVHPNLGIASAILGTSTIGEIDFYNSAGGSSTCTLLSCSVPAAGSYALGLRAWGDKGASATGSGFIFRLINIKRIGNY